MASARGGAPLPLPEQPPSPVFFFKNGKFGLGRPMSSWSEGGGPLPPLLFFFFPPPLQEQRPASSFFFPTRKAQRADMLSSPSPLPPPPPTPSGDLPFLSSSRWAPTDQVEVPPSFFLFFFDVLIAWSLLFTPFKLPGDDSVGRGPFLFFSLVNPEAKVLLSGWAAFRCSSRPLSSSPPFFCEKGTRSPRHPRDTRFSTQESASPLPLP